ncbi:MAG TPA: hypothetical protein VNI53_03450 [Gammaproteobacteria bacterium]|nr:hypothetical protein [Gammaproteobacteria bacterium]
MKSKVLVVAIMMLVGCAHLASDAHAHTLKLAIQDDQACQSQGWHYPEPRYITCRLQIDDQRQYKYWMSLQQMHQTYYQNLSAPPPYPYRDSYRPLNPDHYQCQYVGENGQDYILCSERSKT